jgi:hypothetical protein
LPLKKKVWQLPSATQAPRALRVRERKAGDSLYDEFFAAQWKRASAVWLTTGTQAVKRRKVERRVHGREKTSSRLSSTCAVPGNHFWVTHLSLRAARYGLLTIGRYSSFQEKRVPLAYRFSPAWVAGAGARWRALRWIGMAAGKFGLDGGFEINEYAVSPTSQQSLFPTVTFRGRSASVFLFIDQEKHAQRKSDWQERNCRNNPRLFRTEKMPD